MCVRGPSLLLCDCSVALQLVCLSALLLVCSPACLFCCLSPDVITVESRLYVLSMITMCVCAVLGYDHNDDMVGLNVDRTR